MANIQNPYNKVENYFGHYQYVDAKSNKFYKIEDSGEPGKCQVSWGRIGYFTQNSQIIPNSEGLRRIKSKLKGGYKLVERFIHAKSNFKDPGFSLMEWLETS